MGNIKLKPTKAFIGENLRMQLKDHGGMDLLYDTFSERNKAKGDMIEN